MPHEVLGSANHIRMSVSGGVIERVSEASDSNNIEDSL